MIIPLMCSRGIGTTRIVGAVASRCLVKETPYRMPTSAMPTSATNKNWIKNMSYSYHLRDIRFVCQEECKRALSYCCITQFYRCRNWLRIVFEDQQSCGRQRKRLIKERLDSLAAALLIPMEPLLVKEK